jgi:hypothetical protein
MTHVRLNLFQCAMLRWRELHPYCAAHVIAVPVPLDEARVRTAIAGVLEECGLTGFTLDAARRRYVFAGGPARVDVAILRGDAAAFDLAAEEIRTSINRPFPPTGAFDPFRFFAVGDGGGCLVGVVYDHIVAGGDSVAVLMTDIAARLASAGTAAPLPRLDQPRTTCSTLFRRNPVALLRATGALPDLMRGWRTAVRPRLADPADGTNGFVHFAVDAAAYARLRGRARSLGVTTNDVLLATVLVAAAPLAGRRDAQRRRHGIAIASIVNLRADFQPPATVLFGQFLSSFRVVHAYPEGTAFDALVGDIGRQAARARRERLHFLTLLAMGVAGALWRFASPPHRQRMYLKYHPVLAGVTPLNVDALRRSGRGAPGDYLRAASTGPMSPLVVALTTSGDALRVGITYRTTAVSDAQAQAVVRSMQQSIEST